VGKIAFAVDHRADDDDALFTPVSSPPSGLRDRSGRWSFWHPAFRIQERSLSGYLPLVAAAVVTTPLTVYPTVAKDARRHPHHSSQVVLAPDS